jgi:hypothetical protein
LRIETYGIVIHSVLLAVPAKFAAQYQKAAKVTYKSQVMMGLAASQGFYQGHAISGKSDKSDKSMLHT